MKRIILAAAIVGSMFAASSAPAGQPYSGTILLPSQANAFVGEFANTCGGTTSRLNGIDSHWFTVNGGDQIDLRAVTEGADFDAHFWDANCQWTPGGLATEGDEFGNAPANAAYIMVKLYWGVNAEFLLIVG